MFKPSSTISPVAKRGANTGICNLGAMYPTFVNPVPKLSPILDLLDLMASNYHHIHGFDGSQCIYLDSFSWYITFLYALSSLFELVSAHYPSDSSGNLCLSLEFIL